MKRKNILKFVSLLGIGSFVMLSAASCTKVTTTTPNPNTPSDGGNNNQGGSEGMNNVDPNLAAARTDLTTLINSETQKTELYVDYAKIKDTLTKAYDAAKTVLNNSASTTQNLNDAKTKLETAINVAATGKQTFDQQNAELVKVYKELKTTLSNENATLAPYSEAQFAGIKMHLSVLYDFGKQLISKTLDPVEGELLKTNDVMEANNKIVDAIKTEVLNPQEENATLLAQGFVKKVLVKNQITGTTSTNQQPGNYSFVGYSVDITTNNGSNGVARASRTAEGTAPETTSEEQRTIPNWNYAQRTIFQNDSMPITAADGEAMAQPLSNVSWIYSLAGSGAKYSLSFNYYGPSTGYLYFPYKLVNTSDRDKLGLEYKLNDATQATAITFGDGEMMNGKTPTVGDINIAKVTLSNLKFGENKIEFSVPTNKVNPMIGNMYLSSNSNNWNKVYDDVFGNHVTTEDNKTKVSVDTLSAYSLAADWSTVINQYSGEELTLDDVKSDQKYYLIGYIGGTSNRNGNYMPSSGSGSSGASNQNMVNNLQRLPLVNDTNKRNYIFYVNAPKAGDYYISGIYISGTRNDASHNRWLQFSTGEQNNVVKFETPGNGSSSDEGNWTSKLKTFDTGKERTKVDTTTNKKTLKLKAGLNKITVNGVADKASGDAPNFGNITFTLMNPSQM